MQKTGRFIQAIIMRSNARKQEALGNIELILDEPNLELNLANRLEKEIEEVAQADLVLSTISSLFPTPSPASELPPAPLHAIVEEDE